MSAVTVVIATRNRCADLMQSLPHHEGPVILVDNGSTDDSVAAVRSRFPHVQVIEAGRNLGAPARNLGARVARTPYVAFADDDSWWAPGSLERAAGVFDAHPRLAVLAGRILVGPEARLDPLSAGMATAPFGVSPAGPHVLGFAACGAIVRRSAFLAIGGFDPVVRFPGEEERVVLDLLTEGWLLSYVDDVVAHHHPSLSRSSSGDRQRAIVRSAVLTALLRRPWPMVLSRVAAEWRAGGAQRDGVRAAMRGVPGALRRRKVVPAEIEALLTRPVVPAPARPVDDSLSQQPSQA